MDTAIKSLNDSGRVGGYLVVWGSPQQRDLQNEYFTPETELGLGWYDKRPALYHHGLDQTMKAEMIGIIDHLKADATGVWAEAQLAMHNQYIEQVLKLIKQGVLAWSSGSLPHLVDVGHDGHIKRWPLCEGSMTPTPAEPRHTGISSIKSLPTPPLLSDYVLTIKSAYSELGLDPARLLPATSDDNTPAKEQSAKEQAVKFEVNSGLPTPVQTTQPNEVKDSNMEMNEILQALLTAAAQQFPDLQVTPEQAQAIIDSANQALSAAPAAGEAEQATMSAEGVIAAAAPIIGKAVAALASKQAENRLALKTQVDAAMKKVMTSAPPISRVAAFTSAPNAGGAGSNVTINGAGNNPVIATRTKYADLSAQDMSFLAMLDGFNRAQRGKHTTLKPLIADENYSAFVRETAEKAEAQAIKRTLSVDGAALKSMAAIKANELDHSTQASYGDEWVPDLWSGDLWRRARLDNVILPLFKSFEMPSNPYELPVEGGDPTVYFVPETTQESELLISGSGNTIPDSKIGSGKVTITAKKLALRVGFSAELEEDSIIPILSIYREQADRAMMDAVDHVLLNGDDTNAATGNINLDDADPADTEKYLAFDGLLHSAIVEDTTRKLDAGGLSPTLSMIRATRFKMLSQYALRPKDLVYIVGGEVFAKLLNLDEFLTMEKVGAQATILNGMIGMIDGSPVLTTAELALAEADGKKSTTANNNTLGRLACVYKPNWYVGYKRKVAASMDYLPYYDSYQLTATVRLGFTHFDNDSVGVLYNLAV